MAARINNTREAKALGNPRVTAAGIFAGNIFLEKSSFAEKFLKPAKHQSKLSSPNSNIHINVFSHIFWSSQN